MGDCRATATVFFSDTILNSVRQSEAVLCKVEEYERYYVERMARLMHVRERTRINQKDSEIIGVVGLFFKEEEEEEED